MRDFALHLGKRVADRKEVRDQGVAAVGAEHQVAVLLPHLERLTQEIATGLEMFLPGQHVCPELIIDAGLETSQAALLDQLTTELAKAKSSAVIAKTRACERASHDVSDGRAIAVAP